MSSPHTLFIGDATFAKSFNKISRGEDGAQVSANFSAPKGREFVVLLIGEVEKGSPDADLNAMLNELGYFYKEPENDGSSD